MCLGKAVQQQQRWPAAGAPQKDRSFSGWNLEGFKISECDGVHTG